MSSIGSIGASVASLASNQNRPAGGPPSGPPPGFTQALESAAEQAGLDSNEIADLRTQIEEAVASASESGEGRGAVRDAVNSVLESNGVDVETFKAQLGSMRQNSGAPPRGSQGDQSLAEILAESEDSGLSIFDMLQSLPAGSLVNTSV